MPPGYDHVVKVTNSNGREYHCKVDNFRAYDRFLAKRTPGTSNFSYRFRFPALYFLNDSLIVREYIADSLKDKSAEIMKLGVGFAQDYQDYLHSNVLSYFTFRAVIENRLSTAIWLVQSIIQWSNSLRDVYPNLALNTLRIIKLWYRLIYLVQAFRGNIIPRYIRCNEDKLYLVTKELRHRPGGELYDIIRFYDWILVKANSQDTAQKAYEVLRVLLGFEQPALDDGTFDSHTFDLLKKFSRKDIASILYLRLLGVLGWDDLKMNTLGADDQLLLIFKRTVDLMKTCLEIM